jgi:hypothetical protein
MQKISSDKVAEVLADASRALRTVAAERDAAVTKLAKMEQRADAEKVASSMHHKGHRLDTEFSSLADEMEKAAEQGRLPIIKEALDMMAPNMGFKTASIRSDETTSGGSSDLERFVMGDVG